MASGPFFIIGIFVVSGVLFLSQARRHSREAPEPQRQHLVHGSIYMAVFAFANVLAIWLLQESPPLGMVAAAVVIAAVFMAVRELNLAARISGREVNLGRQAALFVLLFGVPLVLILLFA